MQLGGYRSYRLLSVKEQLSCLSLIEAALVFDERRDQREREGEGENDKEREGSKGRKHVAKNDVLVKGSFASTLLNSLFCYSVLRVLRDVYGMRSS